MAAVSPIQTSFNAGELSPLIAGRIDYQKFVSGCKTMQNFFPTVQGPAKFRPGTHYVANTKNQTTEKVWLIPFVFAENIAFVLEFGSGYVRFYSQHGQVQSGGSPLEIVSPYSIADMTNPDGTFALSFAQSGDVIYIANAWHPPYKLIRLSNTSWTLNPVAFKNGPFQPINIDNGVTVTCSAQTGTVTLTATGGNVFSPSDVGTQFYLQFPLNPAVQPGQWSSGETVTAGFVQYSGLNLYNANNSGTTGNVQPIHTQGAKSDGVVTWQYLSSGYGNVTITAYTSPTQVTAVVNPDNFIVQSTNTSASVTTLWAHSAWNALSGFPTSVTFFRNRLVWAMGTQLFFSVAADFENMATEDAGVVSNDMAIIINIASDRYDQIVWMSSVDELLVGTVGSEYAVAEASTNQAFGPLNVQAKQQTGNGGRNVSPVIFNSSTLFVQRAGRKLREMRYSFATNNYQSIDLTVLSEHITKDQIIDMDFQQEPNYIVWCVTTHGQLLGLTYCREQDTVGWHEHVIGGGGIVESVACIPSPDGTSDELWLTMNVVTAGVTQRFVCYMDQGWDSQLQTLAQAFYVDAGASYVGANATSTTVTLTDPSGNWNFPDQVTVTASAAAFSANDVGGFVLVTDAAGNQVQVVINTYTSTTVVAGVVQGPVPVDLQGVAVTSWSLAPKIIGGLTYLAGQTVATLGDGAPQPPQVVSNTGTITMQYPASTVQVGLPYTGTLTSMRLTGGGQTGPGQGMLKRIAHVIVRFFASLGGQYGNDGGPYDYIDWRSSFDNMNQPPPTYTGDVRLTWNSGTDYDGYVSIQQSQPLPMTVVAIMPQAYVNDPQT